MSRSRPGWWAIAGLLTLCAGLACSRPESMTTARSPAGSVAGLEPRFEDSLLVTARGVGAVRLGMTLEELRAVIPGAKIERTSDGEGAALVGVDLGGGATLFLHAGEDRAEAPIDWSRRVEFIEVTGSGFHTGDGVHPGSLVVDAERVYGATGKIVRSEIEQREFIEFVNQPTWLLLRLDGSGDFPQGSRETTRFKPGARILSLAVATSR